MESKPEEAWTNIRFLLENGPDKNVRWWIDVMLADTLGRDILNLHKAKASSWRFHRRAAQDATGHQFSLCLFMPVDCAETLYGAVRAHPVYELLKGNNCIRDVRKDVSGRNLEDGSDTNWPPELRKAWPKYITGACEMLLVLLEQLRNSADRERAMTDIALAEELYFMVSEKLNGIWRDRGSHAFFHHLNALFAYQPLVAQPRQIVGLLATF